MEGHLHPGSIPLAQLRTIAEPVVVSQSAQKQFAPKQTFFGIQALRGIAAALVVLHHASQIWFVRFMHDTQYLGWSNGAAGVDIFFVISGFVMTITTTGPQRPTGLKFLERRILRIAPIYWLFTALTAASLAITYRHVPSFAGRLHPWHVIASFFFMPSRNIEDGVFPVLDVGWTLCYEMFFYALFAITLMVRSTAIRFLVPLLIVLSCIGISYTPAWPPITSLLRPIILEFAAGILVAYLFELRKNINPWILSTIALLGFAGLLTLHYRAENTRIIFWGLPAFAIVASVMLLEARIASFIPRWLLRVGDASYSLYLSHLFVLNALFLIGIRAHFERMHFFLFMALSLFLSTFVSIAIYRFIEAPLTRTLAHRFGLRPPQIIIQGEHIETAA